MRKYPNIIITGTPGVGKTTTAQELLSLSESDPVDPKISIRHLSINDVAKKNDFYESYDAELDTQVIDEDPLLDHLTSLMSDGDGDGGFVIDWHVCDIFPSRWIDLVVVLRCEDTKVFFERLEKRGYNEKKREENVDAEIFGVITEEAREAYEGDDEADGAQVVEMQSVEAEHIEQNAERIWGWIKEWVKKRNEQEADEG